MILGNVNCWKKNAKEIPPNLFYVNNTLFENQVYKMSQLQCF